LVDVIFDTRERPTAGDDSFVHRRGATADGMTLRTSDLMTASISAVGTKWMSRPDSRVLALLGSGKQARNHLIAMKAIRNLDRVNVFSPTREHREGFAEEMTNALHLDIVPTSNIKEAIQRVDIVLAATNSNAPVFPGDLLGEGMHVTSIVGSNVGMVQAGVIGQKRASWMTRRYGALRSIGIASRELAEQDQQGDIYEQVQSGLISWDKVIELREIVAGHTSDAKTPQTLQCLRTTVGKESLSWRSPTCLSRGRGRKNLGIEVNWSEDYLGLIFQCVPDSLRFWVLARSKRSDPKKDFRAKRKGRKARR